VVEFIGDFDVDNRKKAHEIMAVARGKPARRADRVGPLETRCATAPGKSRADRESRTCRSHGHADMPVLLDGGRRDTAAKEYAGHDGGAPLWPGT